MDTINSIFQSFSEIWFLTKFQEF